LARIRAQVRRARGQVGPTTPTLLRVGKLVLDPARLEASYDGRPVPLTAYEFSLLRILAERAGRILSREQLLDLAKGSAEESFDRSIDVHISRLRQKLSDDSKNPRLLKTIRGAGYMLTPGVGESALLPAAAAQETAAQESATQETAAQETAPQDTARRTPDEILSGTG
jgi:DNA-binding response OmpR family regulator